MDTLIEENNLTLASMQVDVEAFNQIVLKYQDTLYHQAVWLLKDPELAEDMTQNTFLQAYRSLGSFRGGSLLSWMRRILTNLSLDELRRQKRHPILPLIPENSDGDEMESSEWLIDPGAGVEELIEKSELSLQLQAYLQVLPIEQRAALVLVDLQECDYAEAAQILNVPVGTVKSRVARARKQMRSLLLSGTREGMEAFTETTGSRGDHRGQLLPERV